MPDFLIGISKCRFTLLKESLETVDIDAVTTTVPQLAELIQILHRAINAANAVTLDCDRILGMFLAAADAIGNAGKPDDPITKTQMVEILPAHGIDCHHWKAIITAINNRAAVLSVRKR